MSNFEKNEGHAIIYFLQKEGYHQLRQLRSSNSIIRILLQTDQLLVVG